MQHNFFLLRKKYKITVECLTNFIQKSLEISKIMKVHLVLLLSFICFTKSSDQDTNTEKFSDQDMEVLSHVAKYFNSQYFVFIENSADLGLIKQIKNIAGRETYLCVLNSSSFENILAKNTSQFAFFQSRMLIVTKENINLTKVLNEILVPRIVTWIIFREYIPQEKGLYIPSSSDVFFVLSTPNYVTIKQVYHLKRGAGEIVQDVWSWTPKRRNLAEEKPPIRVVYTKNNYHNVSFKMHYLYNDSICDNLYGCSIKAKVECLQKSLLELMSVQLNFSIDPEECIEKEHPYSYPNGTDSEVFVRLSERTIDFSVVGHVARGSRFGKFDYVWPTFVLRSMMYIKQSRFSAYWKSYLRPLDSSIWWMLLFWIVMISLCLLVFEKLLFKKLKWKISLILDYVYSILRVLQVFCSQAVTDIPASSSIRILYLLKLFVFIVFFQAYCGYLVSSLTILHPHYPFVDLKGFFENKKYQIMTLSKGFQRYYFRKVVGAGKRENFMLPDEILPDTIQEAISDLCRENHLAFVEFREDLRDIELLKCKIVELPSPVVTLFLAIGLPKNSPHKELLTRQLLHFQSTGVAKKLNNQMLSYLKFQKKSREEYLTVSMSEVFSVFILLVFGLVLSLVIFTIELVLRRVKVRQNCKKRKIVIEVKEMVGSYIKN